VTPLHFAALTLSAALKLVPRRRRWRALVIASVFAGMMPLLFRARRSNAIAGRREMALIRLLVATSKLRLRFDPVVQHENLGDVQAVLGRPGGVLVVGVHDGLSFLAVRHFFDVGRDPVVVSLNPGSLALGRDDPPRGVLITPTLLPDTLRHLRAGELVCAMLDRASPEKGTYAVDTPQGEMHVSTPLLKVASAAGASILFVRAKAIGEQVRLRWCAASDPASLEAVKSEFAAFLRRPMNERPAVKGAGEALGALKHG
jgi:hypothetical protein